MEPFRLDRQAKVFLAVLVVVALAMVPLAPFMALVFGGLSLVVLCLVFLLALLRNRRAFGPLTRTEGVLALSATVFALGGALVIAYATLMLGAGNAMMLGHAMLPFGSGVPRPGDSSVWYSDRQMQRQLKEELGKAGVPFKLETREGKEYVTWPHEHEEKARAAKAKVHESPAAPASLLPPGRAMSFGDPQHHADFAAWLERKGIRSETVEAHGSRYLVWDEGAGDPRTLMNEFFAERAKRCKDENKTRACS